MKRTLTSLLLVMLLVVTATAFAIHPANTSPVPVNGDNIAELTDFGLPYLLSANCPVPGDTGCGG